MEGADVIRGLRGWTSIPIIVLSGRVDSRDKVGALDAGADDYITKPFGIDELLARIRAVTGRAQPAGEAEPVVTIGRFTVDLAARCFMAYTAHPNGEVWWVANPACATEPTPAELASITPQEWRTRLTGLFRQDRGPAADIIAATDKIFAGWNTYELPTVPRSHHDRMIIVGDAAHATAPSIGQGAAMAIEDAVVLAECLRDSPSITSAFTVYERLRRERVERVVEQGKRTGGWKAINLIARVPRDLIMSLAMKRMARTGNDPSQWIYEHHIDWDEPVRSSS